MRQYLQYLLRLWIAKWITQTVGLLKVLSISRGAMQVISVVRELGCVIAMYASAVRKGVVRRA